MEDLQKKFKEVQNIKWNEALVSFYVVKRKLVKREAKYEILQVNVDKSLSEKIRRSINNKIEKSNQAIEYEYNTSDLDNSLLSIATEETDLEKIIASITNEEPPETADSYESLIDSRIYIVRLKKEGQILYSFRYVSTGWNIKKVSQFINTIFNGNMLVDINQKEIFRIDGKIDFFSFNDVVFIADKKNFETALNFREGMEKNRDEIVTEFKQKKLFVDADEISKLIGNNIKRLRKLSQVKKAGYYKEQNFLENLKKVNESENWGIEYSEDGKLIATEENIETLLTVLNNSRLKSPINEEIFDADVKHKFENIVN